MDENLSSKDLFFGGDFIWIDIPEDPADLVITLPSDRAPSIFTKRPCDPYKNVWCEGNRYIKNDDL